MDDDGATVFARLAFSQGEGNNIVELYSEVTGERLKGMLHIESGLNTGVNAYLESHSSTDRAIVMASDDDPDMEEPAASLSLMTGESLISKIAASKTSGVTMAALDPVTGFVSFYGQAGVYFNDSASSGDGTWTGPLFLCQKSLASKSDAQSEWAALKVNTQTELSLVEILNDLYVKALGSGVTSVGVPGQEDPYYTGQVLLVPGVGIKDVHIEGLNGFAFENDGLLAMTVNGTDSKKGTVDWVIGDNLVAAPLTGEGLNGWRLDAVLGEIVYHPSAITTAHGTPTGSLSDILAFADGTYYEVHEVTGVPGIEATITFSNVAAFSLVQLYIQYTGTGTLHQINVNLYSNTAHADVQIGTVILGQSFEMVSYSIPVSAPFIDGNGTVLLHLTHPQTGNSTHEMFVGYAALVRGQIPSSAISLDLAYDGGQSINANLGPVDVSVPSNLNSVVLDVSAANASQTQPLTRIYNQSTAAAPSLKLFGAAGDGNEFGNEIQTDTVASLRSRASGYDSSINSASFKAERVSLGGGSYSAAKCTISADNDALNNDASLTLTAVKAQTGVGVNGATAELFADTIYISTDLESPGGEILVTAHGKLTLGSDDHATFNNTSLRGIKNQSLNAVGEPSGTTELAVNWSTGSMMQRKQITDNVTSVTMVSPNGPCTGLSLRIDLDGTAKTITGFADGAIPIKWGCTVNANTAAYTIATNSWVVFKMDYWGASIGYIVWAVEPAP
jgi:hypothetical protein